MKLWFYVNFIPCLYTILIDKLAWLFQQQSKDIHHSEETEQKTKKIKNIQDSIDELKHQLEQLEEECGE